MRPRLFVLFAMPVTLGAGVGPAVSDCHSLRLTACPTPVDVRLPAAQEMLSWQGEDRVVGLRNTWRLYPGDVFRTGRGRPSPLPHADHSLTDIHYRFAGEVRDLAAYRTHQRVAGLLLLKNGRIALEYYGMGNTERTLWTSRSVGKSVVSTLVGIAIREGRIHSIDDPIVQYLPELKRTAWDGVTLRQLITHTSGIVWNEKYDDPKSDFAALTECEATANSYPCIMQLISSRPRRDGIAPGELWSYNTGGAWLVGRVLEQATGMSIARYLETRLWSREPMEREGVWQALEPGRIDMGGHGFNATLRDWGRFGLFVERGGRLHDGTQLLPEGWLKEATTWTHARGSVTPETPDGKYGYQWWYNPGEPVAGDPDGVAAVARDSCWAAGIYGQAIAIDPVEHVVMVQWSAWPVADPADGTAKELATFFAAAVHTLR
jgi:CubicO group peptidase (beta-lactamase class C family)